ncbi:MAG TPA: hypothetical protein VK809_13245, partial [Bacteroidia bacterium]|nr:hypothetical protein [Bacteroidia bacterium]
RFLTASGTYKQERNLLGMPKRGKFSMDVTVINTATKAEYKDIKLTVAYCSQTNTELARKNYVAYYYLPPNSQKTFPMELDEAPDATAKINLGVIGATPVQ